MHFAKDICLPGSPLFWLKKLSPDWNYLETESLTSEKEKKTLKSLLKVNSFAIRPFTLD